MRPVVRAFAFLMEQKLRENEHKGGWGDDTAWELVKRLREEVEELEAALVDRPGSGVAQEAADVANFAMMIADNAGGLKFDDTYDHQVDALAYAYGIIREEEPNRMTKELLDRIRSTGPFFIREERVQREQLDVLWQDLMARRFHVPKPVEPPITEATECKTCVVCLDWTRHCAVVGSRLVPCCEVCKKRKCESCHKSIADSVQEAPIIVRPCSACHRLLCMRHEGGDCPNALGVHVPSVGHQYG